MKTTVGKSTMFCEVVRVDTPLFLISASRHACRYQTADGHALGSGYYLAVYADKSSPYDRRTRFIGPLCSLQAAQFLARSAVAFGIAGLEIVASRPIDRLSVLQPAAPLPCLGFLLGGASMRGEAC